MKPRDRLIHPGFFVNEELAELPFEARILFAGLWVIADKAGRLEDKSRRIKIFTLPFDNCDVDNLLNQLCPEFIVRYEVDACRYIQIVNWQKHQKPHWNEKESQIPTPEEVNLHRPYIEPNKDLISPLQVGKGRGKDRGKGKEEDKDQGGRKSDHAQAVKHFCDQHELKFNFKYKFTQGKDGKHIKDLLQHFGPAVLKNIIDAFLSSDDEFLREQSGYTIGAMVSRSNAIVQQLTNKFDSSQMSERTRRNLKAAAAWVKRGEDGSTGKGQIQHIADQDGRDISKKS